MRRLVVFLILELRTTTSTTSRLPRNPEPQMRIESLLYSTLLHLPPLRFHFAGDCWDWNQDCCDFGWHWQSDALTTRLDRVILVHNLHKFLKLPRLLSEQDQRQVYKKPIKHIFEDSHVNLFSVWWFPNPNHWLLAYYFKYEMQFNNIRVLLQKGVVGVIPGTAKHFHALQALYCTSPVKAQVSNMWWFVDYLDCEKRGGGNKPSPPPPYLRVNYSWSSI